MNAQLLFGSTVLHLVYSISIIYCNTYMISRRLAHLVILVFSFTSYRPHHWPVFPSGSGPGSDGMAFLMAGQFQGTRV